MKDIISTAKAPTAIGPYSQAVLIEPLRLVYTAGQIGLLPTTGQMVNGGIQAETRQVLLNLQAVLQASGSDLEHVIKTTVFLTDMNHFQTMNEVYAEFFPVAPPARSAMAVKQLPKNALVEIEVVAVIPEAA
ncbi:RidA family protein [candidate division KSB1 bacterium]|nr:RidA family protein [candidate division KSB1 bacterium]